MSLLFQYFALYTQLESMPEEADDELSIDGENSLFGAKISSKSGAKTSPGKYPATPKIKRKE